MCYRHICQVAGQDGRDQVFDRALEAARVGTLTLDRKPATIRGRLPTFPVSEPQAYPHQSIPFAWATVAHVMDHGGNFQT